MLENLSLLCSSPLSESTGNHFGFASLLSKALSASKASEWQAFPAHILYEPRLPICFWGRIKIRSNSKTGKANKIHPMEANRDQNIQRGKAPALLPQT